MNTTTNVSVRDPMCVFFFLGAVANGRAKFEAQSSTPTTNDKQVPTQTKVSPEKPMRFFGSRSRTNSPMLPVKTPKVPTKDKARDEGGGKSAQKKDAAKEAKNEDKKASKKIGEEKSKVSSTGPTTKTTAKLFPKMKRYFFDIFKAQLSWEP